MEATIPDCIRLACRVFGISKADLLGESRLRRLARPRQVAMWLALEATDAPVQVVAQHFERDHSTVSHAWRAIVTLRSQCRGIAALTDGLLADLGWSA